MADNSSIPEFCKKVDKLGVHYFVCSYTGLIENLGSTLIPRGALERVLTMGAGGHLSSHFAWPQNEPEMRIMPDTNTFVQLPWKPSFGWMMCDIYMNEKPFAQCPRLALKKQIAHAAELGFTFKTGSEMEFILTYKDGTEVADPLDRVCINHHNTSVLMRKADFLVQINDIIEKIGWNTYQIDKEHVNGQFEINIEFTDALTTADRVCFFKFLVKELANEDGYRATFIPQLFQQSSGGSGMHMHVSLWQGDTNVFKGSEGDRFGLSELAFHFTGGILKHAEALTAFACPTVNSYKRLINAAYAPWSVSYGSNNRTVMVRIPDSDRIEYRLPDGSCNPYLVTSALLASGLDGVQSKQNPGKPCRKDISCSENSKGVKPLPRNLLDALRALDGDGYLKETVGADLTSAFLQLRHNQWEEYMKFITDWERKRYLDC